jgi:uncharacterized membrane protein HdeD (DUF308 family)
MSSTSLPETPLRKVIRHELQAIRGKWLWLVVLGIALIVLGTILLGSPVPMSGLTIIGVLVGISLIFRGVSWLVVGFVLKRLPQIAA